MNPTWLISALFNCSTPEKLLNQRLYSRQTRQAGYAGAVRRLPSPSAFARRRLAPRLPLLCLGRKCPSDRQLWEVIPSHVPAGSDCGANHARPSVIGSHHPCLVTRGMAKPVLTIQSNCLSSSHSSSINGLRLEIVSSGQLSESP